MKLKKFPAASNAVRLYDDDPLVVCKKALALARGRPNWSYFDLIRIVQQSFPLRQDLQSLIASVRGGVKREDVRKRYLSVLPHLYSYVEGMQPTYVQKLLQPLSYAAGRDLFIPVDPTFVIGTQSGPVVPWISFWQSNPLSPLQMALLCSIIRDRAEQQPDLEDAELVFVDLSIPKQRQTREVRATRIRDVTRLHQNDISRMLATLNEGLRLAEIELRVDPKRTQQEKSKPEVNPNQFRLLD